PLPSGLALAHPRPMMQCPRCQHENPTQARFCITCGTGLTFSCAKCKTPLPAEAAFCFACGQPVARQDAVQPRFTSPESYTPKHPAAKILTSRSALEGERKQVTVLFADLKSSMELLADRDTQERASSSILCAYVVPKPGQHSSFAEMIDWLPQEQMA